MRRALRASHPRLAPRVQARDGLLWSGAASFPHIFDVTERGIFLVSNPLDNEVAAITLSAKAAYLHGAVGKEFGGGVLQSDWFVFRQHQEKSIGRSACQATSAVVR